VQVSIHIGFHKAGSTALQKGLVRAREILARQGVVYPRAHVVWDAHHMLPWALLSVRREAFDGTPPEKTIADWRAEAEDAGVDAILISSEDFEFLGPQAIRRIRKALGSADVDIYAYVRPQDEYLIAEYKQHVRMAETSFGGSIEQFYYRFPFNGRFNYYQIACRWAEAFGRDRVHVTVYDRQSLVDQDILADFAQWTGLPPLDQYNGGEDKNVSWTNLTALVVSRLNREGRIKPVLREQLAVRLDQIVKQKGLEVELLDGGARTALIECFRESNRKMLAEFPARGDTDRLIEVPSLPGSRCDHAERMVEALLQLVKGGIAI